MNYKCEKRVLDNGLRVLFVPNESTNVVTSLVLFGTGSRHEDPKHAGISHVLEHMFFKGTKRFPTPTLLAKYIDSLGGDFNAFTSKEYTGYYIKLRSENALKGVEYLSELLSNPLFDQKELDKEREVILQEYDMYEDMPSEVVLSKFEEIMYKNNSLGRDTIGTKEAIRSINQEDLFGYKKTHYNYKNAVVVIAGNYNGNKDQLLKQIESNMILGNEPKVSIEKCSDQTEKQVSYINKPIEQSHLVVGFRGAGYDNDDRQSLKMLSVILGGSMSSRMFSEVREKNGLAYSIKSYSGSYIDVGCFETQAGVSDDKLTKALEVILGEYKKIVDNGVTDEEFNIAREIISSKLAISMEDSEELANFYATNELMTGEILSPLELVEKYNKITPSDIISVAKKYFKPEKLVVSIVSKKADKDNIDKLINEY